MPAVAKERREAMRRAVVAVAVLVTSCAVAASAVGKVLRVGSYHGIKGQFSSIQAAVDAARPGDWILVGPGDYKTSHISVPRGAPTFRRPSSSPRATCTSAA
jgi:pectin methylesterase-like acyl-CoA thioesterase